MNKVIRKQIENCQLFLKYWKTVPNENVIPGLRSWNNDEQYFKGHTCNTIACAGGWLTAMPEFVAMGVKADIYGAPQKGEMSTMAISYELFGNEGMFYTRRYFEGNHNTDKEIVTNRFNNQIRTLETK